MSTTAPKTTETITTKVRTLNAANQRGPSSGRSSRRARGSAGKRAGTGGGGRARNHRARGRNASNNRQRQKRDRQRNRGGNTASSVARKNQRTLVSHGPVGVQATLTPPNPIFVAVISDLFNAEKYLAAHGLSLGHALPPGLQAGQVVPFIWRSRGVVTAPTTSGGAPSSFGLQCSPCWTNPITALTYGVASAPTLTGANFSANIAALAGLSAIGIMFGFVFKFTCIDNFTAMAGQVTAGRVLPQILQGTPSVAGTMTQTYLLSLKECLEVNLPQEKSFTIIVTGERVTFDSLLQIGPTPTVSHQTYERYPWMNFTAAPTDNIGFSTASGNPALYRYGALPFWTILFDNLPSGSKWNIETACFGAYKCSNPSIVGTHDTEVSHPVSHGFLGSIEHSVGTAAETIIHDVGVGVHDVSAVAKFAATAASWFPGIAVPAKVAGVGAEIAEKIGDELEKV